MLKGSCACGSVAYEVRGEMLGPVTYCHCWRCRKQSGASCGTTVGIRSCDLVFRSGEDRLASWESSAGTHRFFASCCGSPIFKREGPDPEFLGFRLGTLDTDPKKLASLHFMLGSKAPWVEIVDSLPAKREGVPFGERD